MSIVIPDEHKRAKPYLDKIKLVRGDITAQEVDAIFSLLPTSLDYQGAINQALLAAAGQQLDDFVLEHIFKPKQGDVYAVPGFDLSAKNIIFSFRPPWRNDFDREDKHLISSVRKAMVLAKCMLLRSIAIPPLGSSSRHGYGHKRAARLVLHGILDRLDPQFEEILIVCEDEENYNAYRERLAAIGWSGY